MSAAHRSDQVSVASLAQAVQQRGLAAPALLLIELLKPWQFVASQLLLFTEPLWPPSHRTAIQRYAAWMEDPAQARALADALERPQAHDARGK